MLCTCILWYNLILIINKRIKTIINKFQVTLNGRYKMRTFNTIEEIKLELIEGNLIIKESVTINCNIPRGTIYNLNCWDLTCRNLPCLNLNCGDLTCLNLTCRDLNCRNLDCWDLTCRNLDCLNLTCRNLDCNNLSYYAICSSYNSISCNSYEIRRQNGHAPITLDGSLTIKNK